MIVLVSNLNKFTLSSNDNILGVIIYFLGFSIYRFKNTKKNV